MVACEIQSEGDLPATLSVGALLDIFDRHETWRVNPRYPSYEVSSWGRVRRGEKILRPVKTGRYWVLSLSEGGNVRLVRVHRLVIETFIGPPAFDGAITAHNDGNTDNNFASNLRWASALENQADRVRHRTRTRGSAVVGSKLKEDAIPEIRRRIASGDRFPIIARDFGVSISTISLINRNRIWAHV